MTGWGASTMGRYLHRANLAKSEAIFIALLISIFCPVENLSAQELIETTYLPSASDVAQDAAGETTHIADGEDPGNDESNDDESGDDESGDDESDDDESDDFLDLFEGGLESLGNISFVPAMDVEVSTVSRTESTVARSPAAVFVITNEMIRRSGVRSVPQALRLAPGVHVARMDASTWSISIRGNNSRFANKLLVQIDGRSVYTPMFAGVFWDVQDVLLEDVERIEVIRGPGATVWGANAVNGVINVITKSAKETHGLFTEAGGGNERGFASSRIGNETKNGSWRAYGKWFERDGGFSAVGNDHDDWRVGRIGFRSDWSPTSSDTVTFQGDYYDGNAGLTESLPIANAPFVRTALDHQTMAGGNALFRWTHQMDEEADWRLQVYYDRTERSFDDRMFGENRDTIDIDFQNHFKFQEYHSIVWGLGFRNTSDHINNSFALSFFPPNRSANRFSTFVQDEITLLSDQLYFTIGSKFSLNDYTGFEIQPTARLLYTPTHRKSIWASVSRAVRTPARAEDDLQLIRLREGGVFPTILGNRNIESEDLLAWELGMRSAPTDEFYWDFAAFYNQYTDRHDSLVLGGPTVINGVLALPVGLDNALSENSYGCELASTWQMNPSWKLRGAYSFLRRDMASRDPRNQFHVHSSWDIGSNVEFDLMGRYVDYLSSTATPAYFEMDTRIAWRPGNSFELALTARNMLNGAHPETGNDTTAGLLATEVQREIYGVATWRY